MRSVEVEAIRTQPIFADMDAEQVKRVLRSATLQRHQPDTVLFEAGKMPDHLHVLVSGTVELYNGRAPRECGLVLLTAGDVFMPAATVFNEPYLNSARTLTLSRILHVNAEIVRQEFMSSHPFAINISRVLAGQFRMATRHIIDLKCLSAAQRLAAFLLRLVDESDSATLADLPVSKGRLASRVGMTPETLSRTIQTLADNGLVVRGTKVMVRDRAKIEAFCGPQPYSEAAETGLRVHAF